MSTFAASSLTLTPDPAAAGPGKFAAEEIHRAAAARGLTVVSTDARAPADAIGITLAIGGPAAMGAPQSYHIRVPPVPRRRIITVQGADARGVMYGGLDIAEAIRIGTLEPLQESDHAPYIAQRGIKFNIPLDRRQPSFDDNGTAGEHFGDKKKDHDFKEQGCWYVYGEGIRDYKQTNRRPADLAADDVV